MKFYSVIDTNVIVSAMLKPESVPGQLIQLLYNGIIISMINEDIVNEYYDVLTRNKFNFNDERVEQIIDFLKKHAIYINNETTSEIFLDKSDVVFYEVTMTGRKNNDVYLVTGNMKHFPSRSFIVTPREMLEIINDYFEKDGEA